MPAKSPATTKPARKAPAKTTAVAAKTKATPKAAGKTAASVKPAKRGKPLNGLQKALQPSKELAVLVGDRALRRTEVISKIWAYIKANNLQNPADRREIVADDKLRKVFGKDKVTMFEMNRHLAQHLT